MQEICVERTQFGHASGRCMYKIYFIFYFIYNTVRRDGSRYE